MSDSNRPNRFSRGGDIQHHTELSKYDQHDGSVDE